MLENATRKKAMTILGIFFLVAQTLISGCASQPQPKPLQPAQIKEIQQLNAMKARWRDQDMLDYSQTPGGYAAWQQLNYH